MLVNSQTTYEALPTKARQWAAVAMLTVSTFLVVTSEMLPVGVLTPMAEGLQISAGLAGSTLTITGVVSAAAAIAVPRVIGRIDRRLVLAMAMGAVAVGNCVSALAESFAVLAVSRVILGVGMGAVWGLAAAVAARLVTPQKISLAVAFVVSGVAGASVVGVPLATFVGTVYGWRAAFALFSVLALAAMAALVAALPTLPRPLPINQDGCSVVRRSLMRPVIVIGLLAVTLLVTAHFSTFTFVRPILEGWAHLSGSAIALLLLAFGTSGLVSNFAMGALADRRPRLAFAAVAAGVAFALVALALTGSHAGGAIAVMVLWGWAYGGVSVTGQLWMASAAPDRAEEVTGLYVGLFTGSIALGAFAGGVIFESVGTTALVWTATGLACLALATAAAAPKIAAGPPAV